MEIFQNSRPSKTKIEKQCKKCVKREESKASEWFIELHSKTYVFRIAN